MAQLRRIAGLWLLLIAVSTQYAGAHPLGNFTINHLARIRPHGGSIGVRYVLDIAEIPAFQIMHATGDTWSAKAKSAWTLGELEVVREALHISVDGAPILLRPVRAGSQLRPGSGGLPIIRWVGEFAAAVPDRKVAYRVAVDDGVYSDRRIGWKDIVAGNQAEPTNELRAYPNALLGTPRRISQLSFDVKAGDRVANVRDRIDDTPQSGTLVSWIAPAALSGMFARPNQDAAFVLLTILAAFGLGALHAVEPGHGKALLAVTLVGSRATVRQALILAASLTFAHTFGVIILGVALLSIAGFVSETIYPWITLASGAIVCFTGARVLARYVRERRGADHHHHHNHSHGAPPGARMNFGNAIWAAMSGGVAPCPAAIVVLLAAVRLHEIAYGMLLIVVFSLGLAGVLCGLGLAVVRGAQRISRHSAYSKIAPVAPLVSALVICGIGSWMLADGFVQQGVSAPALLVALLALVAIIGYTLAQSGHSHTHAEEPIS